MLSKAEVVRACHAPGLSGLSTETFTFCNLDSVLSLLASQWPHFHTFYGTQVLQQLNTELSQMELLLA